MLFPWQPFIHCNVPKFVSTCLAPRSLFSPLTDSSVYPFSPHPPHLSLNNRIPSLPNTFYGHYPICPSLHPLHQFASLVPGCVPSFLSTNAGEGKATPPSLHYPLSQTLIPLLPPSSPSLPLPPPLPFLPTHTLALSS